MDTYNYGTGHNNIPLIELRDRLGLTQKQMGEKIGGYNRITIFNIEHGISGGKLDFWMSFQKTFDIPDEQMWAYQLGKEIKADDTE